MPVSWNESLATGVTEVDNQHKELFRQVALLNEAMSKGQGRDTIGKTLDFLGDYVVRHFSEEERRMDEMGCPAAAENRLAHKQFLATFGKLRKRFDEQGASPTLVLEISDTVSDWLIDHISKIDTQLNACATNA